MRCLQIALDWQYTDGIIFLERKILKSFAGNNPRQLWADVVKSSELLRMFVNVFFEEDNVNRDALQEQWVVAQTRFPEFLQTRVQMMHWIREDLSRYKWTAYVRTLTGKTLLLYLYSSATVDDMKIAVANMEGIPRDQQGLICDGR